MYQGTYQHTKWKEDLTKDLSEFPGDVDCIEEDYQSFVNGKGGKTWNEFSDANKRCILEKWQNIEGQVKVIVEIGVDLSGHDICSTKFFIDNKSDDIIYIGMDIRDVSYWNDPEKNVHTIINDSSDYPGNLERLKALGVEQIDILMIDGWHSINQVKRDWEYTRLLSPYGFVAFHDTSCHPGPKNFLPAIDRNKWNVIDNACPDDFGLGFAWKK